jgi:hypothetical protein
MKCRMSSDLPAPFFFSATMTNSPSFDSERELSRYRPFRPGEQMPVRLPAKKAQTSTVCCSMWWIAFKIGAREGCNDDFCDIAGG